MRRGPAILATAAVALSIVLIVSGPSGTSAAQARTVSLPKGPERAYVWADNTGLDGNTAITLVHGATPRQALGLLKSMKTDEFTVKTPIERASTAIKWSEGGSYNSEHYRDSVIAGSLPHGWTVLCGAIGTYDFDTSAVARLSLHGSSITVFQDVLENTDFTYAVKGKVVREFDPFDHSTRVGHRLPQEKGIPFNWRWPMADSLYLGQLLSGVHLTQKDVTPTKSWLGIGLKA